MVKNILQIPHAFQQVLSAEKTPTLWRTLPAFDNLIKGLKSHLKLRTTPLDAISIVEDAIEKPDDYKEEIEDIPAYALSLVLNPSAKRKLSKSHFQGSNMLLMQQTLLEALEPYYQALEPAPRTPPQPSNAQLSTLSYNERAYELLGMNNSNNIEPDCSTLEEEENPSGLKVY
ncbi:hypothetical protein BGW80DRAFT_1467994 [Lactifluus volemus]|nr:hypothetical protein BGW80DRAFT_1467994 [Lactifluus volemus]